MPELPEVQTVLDTLETLIKDKKITDVKVLYPRIVEGDVLRFEADLKGQHFRGFKRRGKYLLFILDDHILVSHLRMEGKYFVMPKGTAFNKHVHVIFTLDDDKELWYQDVRKFGRMELLPLDYDFSHFKGLGVEPFSVEFDHAYVKEALKKRKLPIKTVLLDQSFIAGIGNIYADEILFKMRINPLCKASDLSDKNIDDLILYTNEILAKANQKGGTTIRSYTSSLGVTGRFQQELLVHTKQKCSVCGSEIKKIKVNGRGTYYCPKCQKL